MLLLFDRSGRGHAAGPGPTPEGCHRPTGRLTVYWNLF